MKKKKGLTFDEKRQKLIDVYYEKKEPLNLKEVEKYGTKKGISNAAILTLFLSLACHQRSEPKSRG